MITAMKSRFTVIGLLMVLGLGLAHPVAAGGGNNKWQEGTASIGNNNKQKDCPVGASATARAPGCDHTRSCTAAKNQARANLRAQYTQCGAYITSTDRCLSGPGC